VWPWETGQALIKNMCGFVGIFDQCRKRIIDRDTLMRMNETQHHRGPDEGGIHIEPGIGLGHRRLSIIDLSSGQQPMFNENKSVAVVYNGEIYNHIALMKELIARGHVFQTRCDTEVIVHAWEEWGEACVEHFRGMFAFALWDRNYKRLFLARDRLGIKPLYYALLQGNQVIFSSELKALLVHPDFKKLSDPYAIEDYFAYGYIPEPRTIYKNVFKLPPGHTLILSADADTKSPRQYWDIPFNTDESITEQSAAKELIDRLREAVSIRMISEVPLGAFLSGGVDSSAIVAMMAGLSEDPVSTCSIAFADSRYDEREYASRLAYQYHTNHHVDEVKPDDFELIDMLALLYDEPFADSSAIPTYRVCEMSRKNVTVALSGDGGDENLGGYRRYSTHLLEERLRSIMPYSVRQKLFGYLGRAYPQPDWTPKILRAKSVFETLARNSVEGYFQIISTIGDPLRQKMFSREFSIELQGYHAIKVLYGHRQRAPVEHPLSLIQYLDMKTYLVGDILAKVDRASMAHSLEVRVPILDHKLVEWMSCLPPNFKLRGNEGKRIFKQALKPYIADDILYRPKMGFAVPLAEWFRGPLRKRVRQVVLGPVLKETGIFNQRCLEAIVEHHLSGHRDYSVPIWSLMMFESFQRQVMQN